MKILFSSILCFLLLTQSSQAQDYDVSQEEIEAAMQMLQNSSFTTAVKVEDEYSFDTSVDVLVKNVAANGESTEMKMKMLFSNDDGYYGMELLDIQGANGQAPASTIIFDYVNLKMISLINTSGTKMGVAMDLNQEQLEEWMDDDDELIPSIRKSGKTKSILGYSCEQYIVSNDSGEGEFWVNEDEELKIGMALNSLAKNSQIKSKSVATEYPDGALLEMTFNSKDGSKVHWLATKIKKNIKTTIRTEGYTFMNMGQ